MTRLADEGISFNRVRIRFLNFRRGARADNRRHIVATRDKMLSTFLGARGHVTARGRLGLWPPLEESVSDSVPRETRRVHDRGVFVCACVYVYVCVRVLSHLVRAFF